RRSRRKSAALRAAQALEKPVCAAAFGSCIFSRKAGIFAAAKPPQERRAPRGAGFGKAFACGCQRQPHHPYSTHFLKITTFPHHSLWKKWELFAEYPQIPRMLWFWRLRATIFCDLNRIII
ncbi:MAG: hypothetical protein ACI4KR_13340, partial [Ruminiclostridium sp.]